MFISEDCSHLKIPSIHIQEMKNANFTSFPDKTRCNLFENPTMKVSTDTYPFVLCLFVC